MKNKKINITALVISITLILASCKKLDSVGNFSIKSYQELIKVMSDNVNETNNYFEIKSPDDSSIFKISKNFIDTDFDVLIETNAKPFIQAGLIKSKLPKNMIKGDKIIVGRDLGSEKITYNADATHIKTYEKLVELKRESVKYHAQLGHYSIELNNKNMFEWAKDIKTNDKDIVFVLDPKVFIDAGVDPQKVEGWVFAKIKMMDKKGKEIETDKFLKSFNVG